MKTVLMAFVLFVAAPAFADPTTSYLYWVSLHPSEVEQKIAQWDNNCVKGGKGHVIFKRARAEDGNVIIYDVLCEKNTRQEM